MIELRNTAFLELEEGILIVDERFLIEKRGSKKSFVKFPLPFSRIANKKGAYFLEYAPYMWTGFIECKNKIERQEKFEKIKNDLRIQNALLIEGGVLFSTGFIPLQIDGVGTFHPVEK